MTRLPVPSPDSLRAKDRPPMRLRLVSRFRRMPRVTGVLVSTLILGQGTILSPLVAGELRGRADTLALWGAQAATAAQRRLPTTRVRVNRTVPRVSPPVLTVAFGASPTAEALSRARVFPEPLVPVGGVPSRAENVALARALEAFAAGPERTDRARVLQAYLAEAQGTPWRASVAVNLGTMLWRDGYFSRATQYWTDAWDAAKTATAPREKAVADVAMAELLTHHLTFGQVPALERRLGELEGRPIGGTAGNKVETAREGLGNLRFHHGTALFSGTAALSALLDQMGTPHAESRKTVMAYQPGHDGMTLADVQALGMRAGMAVQMRRVSTLSELPMPAIVHFKSEHYSTVVEHTSEGYVLRDAALGGFVTVSAAALEDEMSGFVVVPQASANVGRAVTATEATTVVGHCVPGTPNPNPPCPCPGGGGMPVATLHPMTASVFLTDTPLSYSPPRGPSVAFRLQYSQRTTRLPQIPTFGHTGPLWSHNWMSWVTDNVTSSGVPGHWADVVVRAETVEQYNTFNGPMNWQSRATLVKVSHDPPRYERRLPDSTVEVFTLPDAGASQPYRRIFLTQVIDPQGQALTFTYDSSVRLVAVTDALGQVTTLEYLDATDPLRVTKVTDPFGRFALITYDGQGRIETLTDTTGLASRIAYEQDDFVQALTTPYGTTAFRRGSDISPTSSFRRVEATDPEGGTERIEYHFTGTALSLPASVPVGEVPAGFETWNADLDKYNSLHWDKKAMAEAPGNPARATLTHWLVQANMAYLPVAATFAQNIPHSIKRPLETRVWYRYPNQSNHVEAGTGTQPTEAARLLENGTTQNSMASYNTQGMVTSKTDPLGRQTTYTYAANGIDLLEVRQVNGGSTDLLATYAGYNALHLPATVTDAAGQTTTTTYNAAGQPLTVTNAKNEVTTYTYQVGTGYLQTVTGPVSGSTTTYAYDGFGRISSVTEPDGYSVTMLYDALNRLTRRTYPDATYEETTYTRLDAATERDRKGRITRHFYDGLGRRTSTRDPQGRVITQVWCACGALDALLDANGNRTSWERDWQNRVTREVRADGTTDTLYTYDATGRLKTVTDPKNQVTTHTYATDDSLLTTVYTNATIPTPGVTYTYDPVYPRVLTMVDGIGTTTYAYKAPGVLGAGQVASVDGPLTNDTITYTYDQLGRVTVRAINGAANTVTWAFDALGRVTSETNVLGAFTYTYDGVTTRISTVTYPNNQTSTYSYLPNNQDHRLQTIHHKYPNGTTLSKFDYTYDAVGNILTWRQQADTTAVNWRYGYDAADQLTSAIKESTDPVPVVQKRYAYGYDPAGNRLFEQIDDQVMAASHDTLNRLTQHTPGGPLQFVGTVNEPASVTIAGQPAVVDPTNTFRGPAPTINGTTTVSITATDPSGNVASRQYEVDVTGAPKTFTYDANGNMTSDGTRTFEWDARNRLSAVHSAGTSTAYLYSGLQLLVRVTHTAGGTVVSDELSLNCGESAPCEIRAASTGAVARRLFPHGEETAGVPSYSVRDHLSSVSAVVTAGLSSARYSYDPWGRRTVDAGAGSDTMGFAGLRWSEPAQLHLGVFRSLDSSVGRWTRQDPAGMVEGPNLFSYVRNRPTTRVDPLGLCTCEDECPSGSWELSSYTVTIGILAGSEGGSGTLRCKGKNWIARPARIGCALMGLYIAFSVNGNSSVWTPAISGVCSAKDLKPVKSKGWVGIFPMGSVSVSDGALTGISGSVGPPGAGFAFADCLITPK